MSTATVGIIVTGLVAIAGFVASEVRARRAAEEAKTLMQQQYENEHDLRRRDRTFQNLREAYLRVLRWTMLADQQVWALEPLQRGRGFQPPEDLDEEVFREMWVEAEAFGSADVREAIRHLNDRYYLFMSNRTAVDYWAGQLDEKRAQSGVTQDDEEEMKARLDVLQDGGEELRDGFKDLRDLIRDELANV